MSNKTNSHAEKVLKNMSKKGFHPEPTVAKSSATSKDDQSSLKQQYDVIKNDLLKLREDLSTGYDLAKGLIERKTLISEILKIR